MLRTAKESTAPWSILIDLRRVGIAIGAAFLVAGLGVIITLYALALSHPEWKMTPAFGLTGAVGVGLFVCAVAVFGFTFAIKAVADAGEAYQAGMKDLIDQLAKAIPHQAPGGQEARRRPDLHVVS
ncbi:hypothetical protein [Micromonospora maritima]|uniref:hypothetical protein n=1 Tax=Micromonospora maritima TaxID=986711 RepID=UPI00157DEC8E|nr:hypothetical protein [Micromonospora maritima]